MTINNNNNNITWSDVWRGRVVHISNIFRTYFTPHVFHFACGLIQ